MTDTLNGGESLGVNEQIQSNGGRYVLVMQDDGNLVLYEGVPSAATARWSPGTLGLFVPPVRAEMRQDGNFVLCTSAGLPVWSTRTGTPGSRIVLRDDRNLVVYDPDNRELWASATQVQGPAQPPTVPVTAVSPPKGSRDAERGWGLEVGWNKFITTNATLYRDGRLVAEVYSECRNPFSGLRARVLLVCVDDAGRAIWVSEDFDAGLCCSFLDPTCPSFRREVLTQEFPEVVGRYTQRLDIYAADAESLVGLRERVIEGIRTATEIAVEVKNAFISVFGP